MTRDRAGAEGGRVRLLTVGHGTAGQEEFTSLLRGAGVAQVVDVRSAPGSRRLPHFRRAELAAWLPAAGIGYRWEPALGGFRKPVPGSPHVSLRHQSFRAYADHMSTGEFRMALAGLLAGAAGEVTAIMCAESLWWRCHRRLIADAATVLHRATVCHLGHDGRLSGHQLTAGLRVTPEGGLVYDAPVPRPAAGGG